MNEKISIDLKALKFIFYKNKSYILPITIIMVSIILFFQFVIPQFGALLETNKEAQDASLKLETLKENLNVLANVNEQTLDSQLKILSLALPLNKDFIEMLNSVYSTAQKTGVNLGNFSFKVGYLSKSENSDNFPSVKLSVPINSDIASINRFVEVMAKTTPLVEVDLIKIGGASSVVNLSFYYKPLSASNYSQDASINPISQKVLTLVNQLSEFGDNISSFSGPSIPAATSSAGQ